MRIPARWAATVAIAVGGPLMVVAATPAHAATTPGCPKATGDRITDTPPTFPKTVALTFDDGPNATWTPQVLALLAKHHVHGTFFVVGRRAAALPEMLQRIVDAGHVVGNHTWDHPTGGKGMYGLTRQQLVHEIDPTTAMIQDVTGRPVCFFRAPQGKDHTPTIRQLAEARGLVVTGFHTASDYQQPDHLDPAWVHKIEQRLENLGPHPVILLHDGGTYRGNSVAALGHIITWYASRGYLFTDPMGRPFPGDPAVSQAPRTGWAIPPNWKPPADPPADLPFATAVTRGGSSGRAGGDPSVSAAPTTSSTGSGTGKVSTVTPSDLPSSATFAGPPSTTAPAAVLLAALAAKDTRDPLAARAVTDALTRYLMVFSSPPE